MNLESVKILTVENKKFSEGAFKEVIHIRVAAPSLNKDGDHSNLASYKDIN